MALALAVGLVAPGAVAAQPPAGDGGRRLPPSPVVVDAHGRVVGAVFGVEGVKVRVGDRVAQLRIGRDQFLRGESNVVFESTDCSGPPLLAPSVPPGPAAILAEVGVGPPRVLLAPGGPSQTRTVRSQWFADRAPPDCATLPAAAILAFPGEALMDLGVFTPPFRID
jgi:hypothetical protein